MIVTWSWHDRDMIVTWSCPFLRGRAWIISYIVQSVTIHCNTLQLTATCCNTLPHTTELSVDMVFFSPGTGILSYVKIHGDLLRVEGVRVRFEIDFISILDGARLWEYAVFEVLAVFVIVVVLGFNTFTKVYIDFAQRKQRVDSLQHCTTLQHTATHNNILQHTATHRNTLQDTATHCNTLQHTATHCNTLQHTATHCDTLQHTATHCNTQ